MHSCWVVWACRCLDNTNTAQIWLRKAWLDAVYILRPAQAAVSSISYSSSARGPRELKMRECRAPGIGDMSALGARGENYPDSRHGASESPGLCGERLDIGALMRTSWSSRLLVSHHPNLFINALHILVHDVYSLNTCLHKIISSANNAEAQEERHGMVCLHNFPSGPPTDEVEDEDETWN